MCEVYKCMFWDETSGSWISVTRFDVEGVERFLQEHIEPCLVARRVGNCWELDEAGYWY